MKAKDSEDSIRFSIRFSSYEMCGAQGGTVFGLVPRAFHIRRQYLVWFN